MDQVDLAEILAVHRPALLKLGADAGIEEPVRAIVENTLAARPGALDAQVFGSVISPPESLVADLAHLAHGYRRALELIAENCDEEAVTVLRFADAEVPDSSEISSPEFERAVRLAIYANNAALAELVRLIAG